MKDRVPPDIGACGRTNNETDNWHSVDWQLVERRVSNLRQRIYRATRAGQWRQVRSLTKLMLKSYSNLLLSVRRIAQENKGKRTAGIDRQTALTPKARTRLVQQMRKLEFWKANPTRRVYIPKPGKPGQVRPLGIPTLRNRVVQAIVKNALEPSWEARFEANSYGFRPGRSCHDAIEHCWMRLNKRHKDRWVLDADIQGAFDNISHQFILDAIGKMPGRELIKQWLKAGYVEAEVWNATESGVPQGSIIGPLLSNIALDGMQRLLAGKAALIRYADDLVVTAPTRERIETVVPTIEQWLAERGLRMHPEKTKIVSVYDGFDFLGFHIRYISGKCFCMPQKEKVSGLLRKIRSWLKSHPAAPAATVIFHLNPILIGWSNYYKHGVSKQTFGYVAHAVWNAIWKWTLRRHPTKSKDWVRKKYFTSHPQGDSWRFHASTRTNTGDHRTVFLFHTAYVPITRHVKVRGTASPDDPSCKDYWEKRQRRKTIAADAHNKHQIKLQRSRQMA